MKILTWILSSSVLILTVMLLRRVLKGYVQPGVRYALWGLVLLRLLVPWEAGHVPFGVAAAVYQVMAAAEDAGRIPAAQGTGKEAAESPAAQRMDPMTASTMRPAVPGAEAAPGTPGASAAGNAGQGGLANTGEIPDGFRPAAAGDDTAQPQADTPGGDDAGAFPEWQKAILIMWAAGAALTAVFIVAGNVKLYRLLRRYRTPLAVPGMNRVYAVQGLASSCLFGRSIYVTGEALDNETLLHYVLAHENSHARHGDFAWSVLRCLALVIHWFNPLVWQAAELSRRDAEAFADAGALRELGDDERQAYGLALIRLYAGRSSGVSLDVTASTMTGGKKTLKERIACIASRPRLTAAAGMVLVLCVGLAAACSFGGSSESGGSPEGEVPTGEGMEITEVISEITGATALYIPDYPFSGHLDEENSRTAWDYLKDVRVSFLDWGVNVPSDSDQAWMFGVQDDRLFSFDEENAVMTVRYRRLGTELTARYAMTKNGEPYIPEDLFVWMWNTLLAQGHPRRPDRVDDTEPITRAADRNTAEVSGWAGSPVELSSEDISAIQALTEEWIARSAQGGDRYDFYMAIPLTVHDRVFYCLEGDGIAEAVGSFHDASWDEDVSASYCWYYRRNSAGKWEMIDIPTADREAVMTAVREMTDKEDGHYRNLAIRWPYRERDLSGVVQKGYSVHDDWLVAEGDCLSGDGSWQYWSCLFRRGEDGVWSPIDQQPDEADETQEADKIMDRAAAEAYTDEYTVSYDTEDAAAAGVDEELAETVELYLKTIHKSGADCRLTFASAEAVDAFADAADDLAWDDTYETAKVLYAGGDWAALTVVNVSLRDRGKDVSPCYVILSARKVVGEWYIEKAAVTDYYLTKDVEPVNGILREVYRENMRRRPLTEEDIRAAAEAAFDAQVQEVFTMLLTEEERTLLRGSLRFEYDPSWSERLTVWNQTAMYGWLSDGPISNLKNPSLMLWVQPTEAFLEEHGDIAEKYLGDWQGYYFHCYCLAEPFVTETGQTIESGWHAEFPFATSIPLDPDPSLPHNRAAEAALVRSEEAQLRAVVEEAIRAYEASPEAEAPYRSHFEITGFRMAQDRDLDGGRYDGEDRLNFRVVNGVERQEPEMTENPDFGWLLKKTENGWEIVDSGYGLSPLPDSSVTGVSGE